MIPMSEWKWFGNAGHLCVSNNCRFHMTTLVGKYLVSTVGQYFPDYPVREILAASRGVTLEGKGDEREYDYMNKIGYEDLGGRIIETKVFHAGKPCSSPECGCGLPEIQQEVDSLGYNTAAEATEGHMERCKAWAAAQFWDEPSKD